MDIQSDFSTWLLSLKGWQTELAYRILSKQNLGETDYSDIIQMLKENQSYNNKDFPNISSIIEGENITLLSIGEIQNIELLSPKNILTFAEQGITVIYGSNGSGKSGYTRILKSVCGKPKGRDLIGNIYNSSGESSKCKLTFKVNGEVQECIWEINSNAIPQLKVVDIFDTDKGLSYLNEANTTSYVPSIVGFFSHLSEAFDRLKSILTAEKQILQSILPVPPKELSNSNFIQNIYFSDAIDDNKFGWTKEDENSLRLLENRLRVTDSLKISQRIREQKEKLDRLINEFRGDSLKVTKQRQDEIIQLTKEVAEKNQAVIDAGKVLGEISQLDGIGSESWKALWQSARQFAMQEAHKGAQDLSKNERCVLCHQILDIEAKKRLEAFETFVSDSLSKDAEVITDLYKSQITKLPAIVEQEVVDNKCIAAGLDEHWSKQIFCVWNTLYQNGVAIREGRHIVDIAAEIQIAISALEEKSRRYEKDAIKYEEDARQFDRKKAQDSLLELKSRKWCSEQIESIKSEKVRQNQLIQYDKWIRQTNTKGITTKANEIGEIIITQEYVNRFNEELKKLGAINICVEIVKQTYKGTTRHALRIANAKHNNPIDILSEGEARIIALASFIADVTGGNTNNPFIFDDPISSLDQIYEEKTVKRLVELSLTRQVIVFTHRLSLLGQLCEACEKERFKAVGIRKEHWGAGEIGDTPFFAKKPDNALKNIKQEKLNIAKRIYEQDGYEAFYPYGKMLCSDIRILIERIVELYFLADVVQRYRQAINTKGKVEKLAKITSKDCQLVDKFMTKYSCFEHSQPQESPIEIPAPEEITNDVNELLAWIEEFNKRM